MLAMLRKEEILGAQALDGGVQRVIIEQDGAENAAFGFEIVRERTFESGIAGHYSLYFRLTIFRTQEGILRWSGILAVRTAAPCNS